MFYTSAYIQERGTKFRGCLRYKDPSSGAWKTTTRTLKAKGRGGARRELAEWRAEMERAHSDAEQAGVDIAATTTVPDYVTAYVDMLERGKVIERSTVRGYRGTLKHIREGFGGVALRDLDARRAQEWEARLTGRGLSSSTVGKAHRLLKQALSYAVNTGELDRNPLATVRPPKRANKNPGINALDAQGFRETIRKLNGLNPTPATVAARIALYTGLREGEICGLQWGDLNTKAGSLRVERSIGDGAGGTYVKRPKTDKARTIYLPSPALATLDEWRDIQTRERNSWGLAGPGPRDYILGDVRGAYLAPERLSREWRTLAKSLAIVGTAGRRCTFHDLRHTWATLYIANGGDAVTAANNLGHANPSMTLNVYSAKDPNAQRQAPRLIEQILDREDPQE